MLSLISETAIGIIKAQKVFNSCIRSKNFIRIYGNFSFIRNIQCFGNVMCCLVTSYDTKFAVVTKVRYLSSKTERPLSKSNDLSNREGESSLICLSGVCESEE